MIRGGFWGGAWGLSWGGAWGEAWQLLNQPYQELSLKGQVFVRSYLASVYSTDVAERIVAVAKVNGLSVRDAEAAVAAKVGETSLPVVRRKAVNKLETEKPPRLPAKRKKNDVCTTTVTLSESAVCKSAQTVVQTKDLALRVLTKTETLFAASKPKRAAIK